MNWDQTNMKELRGVGDKTASLFARVGVTTLGDLMTYYPRGYDVYENPVAIAEVSEGYTQTIQGMIQGAIKTGGNRKMAVTLANIGDGTGSIQAIWFRLPYLRSTLKSGTMIILRGRILRKKDRLIIQHPEIFYPPSKYDEKKDTLQPLYPLTTGLSNHMVQKMVRQALALTPHIQDPMPVEIQETYQLKAYDTALRNIHFPENKEDFYRARKRLVFQEFFAFILGLRELKEENVKAENSFQIIEKKEVSDFVKCLPYELTGDQKKVWQEIRDDLTGPHLMSRLVQGDVGSGKTIIALLALMTVAYNGYQGCLMAPTEVLARQHYDTIQELFSQYHIPLHPVLLTGSMTAAQKKGVYQQMISGEADLVIGTHALIQKKAQYRNLALVVTDEQHRFGVRQREQLAGKGDNPHILVMSATPIPRTLAIILYGDLEVSRILELPAERKPIKNCVVNTDYRPTAYHFIQSQVAEGRQCYVICPLVEESESLEAENVIDYAATLQEALGDAVKVTCLHGRMKQEEKEQIMEDFKEQKYQVLVSTTVIEVGINVPNATVMLIENAERFGLAQLHQLRGRVGRGAHQSYCIFMTGSKEENIKKRMQILEKSNDGFRIAEEDLKLRGPGDLFGIRQSGLMDFRLADIYQDGDILQDANEAVNSYQKMTDYAKTPSVIEGYIHIL